jgi:hypothetical protein
MIKVCLHLIQIIKEKQEKEKPFELLCKIVRCIWTVIITNYFKIDAL